MQITLGLELDGGSYPDVLAGNPASAGKVVTGPRGFISILETRMGLSADQEHEGVRIGQYLKRLSELDDGVRFYSDSFNADAWSVAKQLLEWRDELVSHGWRGEMPDKASERLKDLSRLENLHNIYLAPGFGDRLLCVINKLKSATNTGISEIRCVEPPGDWPPRWKKVLSLLAKSGVVLSDVSFAGDLNGACQEKDTDLGRLKSALLRGEIGKSGIQGDGSLVLVRSEVDGDISALLSSWLENTPEKLEKTLFIRGSGSFQLCNRLHSHNLPSVGWESRSQWRTSLQILPLIVSNLWAPFDPQILLEILTLPKSPIPRGAAVCFESALREHPGIGGPLWQKAWDKALEYYADHRRKKSGGSTSGGEIEQFREQLLFWLGEQRYDPSLGVPVKVVSEICAQVSEWAAGRGALDEDRLLAASASMANDVAKVVQATGREVISKAQIDRIMDSVMGAGLEHPYAHPEAAPWMQVTSPGQIWGNVSHIVWLDFVAPGIGTFSSPWSREEDAVLKSIGVDVEDSRTRRLRHSRTWLRPVQHATERLTLVVPGSIVSENLSLHPLWDEIRYLLGMKETDEVKITIDASLARKVAMIKFFGKTLGGKCVNERPLPKPSKEWHVPNPVACIRKKESPTSMQRLIACPLSWVLHYILKLERGRLISLPDAKQMMGSLAHAVIENLFAKSATWKPSDAGKAAEAIFDSLVPQMAAQLLQPGWEIERERCRQALKSAASGLASILNDANLRVAGCEITKQKDFRPGRKFEGRIDMVLEGQGRREFFLDLKWSGSSKYRYQEAKEGESLQLAAYGWLLTEKGPTFPPGGYYMLAQGEMFASPCSFLHGIHIVQELNLEEIWRQALRAYDSRLNELERGLVLAAGLEESGSADESHNDGESNADQLALKAQCSWCDYANLCGAPNE